MDTIFDYIVDAAYKIEEYGEAEFFGATKIEGNFSSFTVIHDLKHAYITNNYHADVNKNLFCRIFVEMLNERKRLLDIEQAEEMRLEQEHKNKEFQLINYAGSMSGC